MGEVIKMPGVLLTADEVLEAEKGTYAKVILMGVTHDNQVYCSAGGTIENHEVVYLCEMLKMEVIMGAGFEQEV